MGTSNACLCPNMDFTIQKTKKHLQYIFFPFLLYLRPPNEPRLLDPPLDLGAEPPLLRDEPNEPEREGLTDVERVLPTELDERREPNEPLDCDMRGTEVVLVDFTVVELKRLLLVDVPVVVVVRRVPNEPLLRDVPNELRFVVVDWVLVLCVLPRVPNELLLRLLPTVTLVELLLPLPRLFCTLPLFQRSRIPTWLSPARRKSACLPW